MANGRKRSARIVYQIRVRQALDERWSDWFDGMTIDVEQNADGTQLTTLMGAFDQSTLHGILARIRDLNLTLVSVAEIQPRPRPSRPTSDLQGGNG
jgi:hypothetical protein